MNEEQIVNEFVEKGANLEHERWAKWQNYLHSFLVWNNEIQMWTLPNEKKEWWDSEIRTLYSMLNEEQKESDRKETRNYISLLHLALKFQQERLVVEIGKMQPYMGDEEDTFFQTRDNIIDLIKKTL